jgi:hypothetical protein
MIVLRCSLCWFEAPQAVFACGRDDTYACPDCGCTKVAEVPTKDVLLYTFLCYYRRSGYAEMQRSPKDDWLILANSEADAVRELDRLLGDEAAIGMSGLCVWLGADRLYVIDRGAPPLKE